MAPAGDGANVRQPCAWAMVRKRGAPPPSCRARHRRARPSRAPTCGYKVVLRQQLQRLDAAAVAVQRVRGVLAGPLIQWGRGRGGVARERGAARRLAPAADAAPRSQRRCPARPSAAPPTRTAPWPSCGSTAPATRRRSPRAGASAPGRRLARPPRGRGTPPAPPTTCTRWRKARAGVCAAAAAGGGPVSGREPLGGGGARSAGLRGSPLGKVRGDPPGGAAQVACRYGQQRQDARQHCGRGKARCSESYCLARRDRSRRRSPAHSPTGPGRRGAAQAWHPQRASHPPKPTVVHGADACRRRVVQRRTPRRRHPSRRVVGRLGRALLASSPSRIDLATCHGGTPPASPCRGRQARE